VQSCYNNPDKQPKSLPCALADKSLCRPEAENSGIHLSPTLEKRRVLSTKIGRAPFDELKVFSHACSSLIHSSSLLLFSSRSPLPGKIKLHKNILCCYRSRPWPLLGVYGNRIGRGCCTQSEAVRGIRWRKLPTLYEDIEFM
jgi:hypothetical protein